jgi:hypothetical protein
MVKAKTNTITTAIEEAGEERENVKDESDAIRNSYFSLILEELRQINFHLAVGSEEEL